MHAPTITELPDPPLRTEAPATFVSKAEAWVAALGEFVGEANALAAYMDSLVGGTLDSDLAAIAALSTTPFGRGLLELANAGAARATLGVNRREFISQIVGTALGANEVLCTILPPAGETWTFPADLATSSGRKLPGGSNPASTYTIDLQKDGSSVGSIAISTTGAVSFWTSGSAAISLTGGTDVLQAVGPATADEAAVGYVLTLVATVA